jgi:hypothetical protein
MAVPCFYDAVILRHFGTIRRLDALADRCKYLNRPYWTQAVADEISEAAEYGFPGCRLVRDADWLGDPIAPKSCDLKGIYLLQVGLNDGRQPPDGHGGEAEGIYFAKKLGGRFVTDDNAAYDFAVRHLGRSQVQDTVDLLRSAVSYGDMDGGEALNIFNAIRNCGRDVRRVHGDTQNRAYFER